MENLPPHDSVTVSYSLYIISTMDGNAPPYNPDWGPDLFGLSTDAGDTLLWTTFCNNQGNSEFGQAYPGEYPKGKYPAQSGSTGSNVAGDDIDYTLSFTFYHTSNALIFNFIGHQTQEIFDESWGLDNVVVRVSGEKTAIINGSKNQSFGNVFCNSTFVFDTTYIHNIGTDSLTINSSFFSERNQGFSIDTPMIMPIVIPPSDSIPFIIRFNPDSDGFWNDTMLIFSNDTISGHDPWKITFSGSRSGPSLISYPLNFGDITPSQFPDIKTLYVRNIGDTAVNISAAYFDGIVPFMLVGGLPVTIAPGDSSPITLQFDDPGLDSAFIDTLNFIYTPNCGQFVTMVSGSRGVRPPVIEAPQQSAIPSLICENFDLDTIVIYNTGGSALNITLGLFTNGTQGFSLISPALFPVTIASGDSGEFVVQFIPPTGFGSFSDTLVLTSNDTSAERNPWRIAFSGSKDTNSYFGNFTIPLLSASPGEMVFIPIIANGVNTLDFGREITLRIRYNPTILLPLTALRGTIDSIGSGIVIVTCTINNLSDTAGLIQFIAALGDSTATPLMIDSIWTDHCPLTVSEAGGSFQLMDICTQGDTRLYLQSGNASLSQNAPNPFSDETEFAYTTIENGNIKLFVTDVLGRQVYILKNEYQKAGQYRLQFDAVGLKSGVYFYVLQTPTQIIRKSMIIEN